MNVLRYLSLILAGALAGCACPQERGKDAGWKDSSSSSIKKKGSGKDESWDDGYVAEAEEADDKMRRFEFEDLPSNQQTGQALVAAEGEEAEFVDANGRPVRLSDFRGKPLELVFARGFVGWVCPYCSTYTAQIAHDYPRIQALGAEVLLVYPAENDDLAVLEQFTNAVNAILEEEGDDAVPFPVALDPGLRSTRRFNLLGDLSRPSTFVLDGGGTIRYAFVGETPEERPAVSRIVEELEALRAGK